MEKKLKINFILKGIAVFAFVAFCLLAILAAVTLPFVSNASTVDCSVSIAQSDFATASAQTQNLVPGLNYDLPDFIKTAKKYNQLTNNEAIYGIAFNSFDIADFWSIAFTSSFTGYAGNSFIFPYRFKLDNIDYFMLINCHFSDYDVKFYFNVVRFDFPTFDEVYEFSNLKFSKFVINGDYSSSASLGWNYLLFPKCFVNTTLLSESEFGTHFTSKMLNSIYFITEINSGTSEIDSLQAQLTEKQNQIDTLTSEKTALLTQLSNMNFLSHFGNFDGLGSSDFYVNLSTDIVLPDIFDSFTNNSTPINGWFKIGEGANMSIYGLNLFDRFYYNGTEETGLLNCGFQLTRKSIPSTTMPPTYTIKGTLQFIVFDTLVWSADCDFNYDTDTKVETITNIHNGSFKVSSNYDKDTNVYKFTAPSDKLYLLNENYNKSYDTFRSFVVQQDYKNTKVPSDNALYLNGYQSASKDFYNNGYNDGVAAGEKSGYNKGFTAGDAQGYNRGVEVGGNYSFLGLFGAIFDAPIQAIFGGTTTLPAGTTITDKNGNTTTLLSSATVHRAGLLNFEVMGVNLSGFVLAMFSLSIIVVVIKFALAKK